MNVLSNLLNTTTHGVFNFHSKCKKISLTQLYFVDDLLIFSRGNLESITEIHNVMKLFYSYSRLQLNCAKSELFSTRIKRELLKEIHQLTGFKIGTLQVRYLGVPLVTRRLTARDCSPLVEKITAKINCWSSKLLFYAGRLQLIQFVQ